MTTWQGYSRDAWNARISAARLKVTIDKQRGVETPAWIRELAARPRPVLEEPKQSGSAA
ncbi:MAG: hypothetical protein JWM62_3377 [Frankiales bacterium]|nr:hypothetical protein [Frankiales bacterium]